MELATGCIFATTRCQLSPKLPSKSTAVSADFQPIESSIDKIRVRVLSFSFRSSGGCLPQVFLRWQQKNAERVDQDAVKRAVLRPCEVHVAQDLLADAHVEALEEDNARSLSTLQVSLRLSARDGAKRDAGVTPRRLLQGRRELLADGLFPSG